MSAPLDVLVLGVDTGLDMLIVCSCGRCSATDEERASHCDRLHRSSSILGPHNSPNGQKRNDVVSVGVVRTGKCNVIETEIAVNTALVDGMVTQHDLVGRLNSAQLCAR